MIKDTDTTFKWMDSTGTLQSTRPTAPITMNASVVDWTNPYGSNQGNQSIPVLSTPLAEPTGGGVHQVTEAELKTTGRTYSFDFNGAGFIVLPTILKTDIAQISSRLLLMEKIHIQGMPHDSYELGSPGKSQITIE